MRIKDVDFPPQLLEAQQDSSLVVFAGAGVSIPAPSNFPNFDDLANLVVGGVLPREHYGMQSETVDRFLGRAKDYGIKVHDRVRNILSDASSAPTSLHTTLLRLFKSSFDVRLVTTNFDLHFTTAFRTVFPEANDPEVFHAPALPIGNSFNGIVHLHGSVAKEPGRMVLTDSDFGAAYLTEGWATRFLQRLFAHNAVLFVGYSHNDIIIDYLARGLPPRSPGRFALTLRGYEPHWKRLGITPVTYPEGSNGQKHSALVPAIASWAEQVSTPVLEHETRIKTIVQQRVTLDPEELDYLTHRVCRDPVLAQFFIRYAKTPDWLRWADQKGFLSNLFTPGAAHLHLDTLFASWIATHFAWQHPSETLALVQKHNGELSELLWYEIAVSLHRLQPPHNIVARWLPVLIHTHSPGKSTNLLLYRLWDPLESTCRHASLSIL